tara:strand:- start:103 stop:279 length:177 start_codon:yes stop_codon:yes gene_type:complete
VDVVHRNVELIINDVPLRQAIFGIVVGGIRKECGPINISRSRGPIGHGLWWSWRFVMT